MEDNKKYRQKATQQQQYKPRHEAEHAAAPAQQHATDGKPENVHCSQCGAQLAEGTKYCETCGASALMCPYCHRPIPNGTADVCMHCGLYIKQDVCSFCGADIPTQVSFCETCGSPHGMVKCMNCGTSGFTAFCSRCGEAVAGPAKQLLQMFGQTPQYHQIEHLSHEIATLELEMQQLEAEMQSEMQADIQTDMQATGAETQQQAGATANIVVAQSAAQHNELNAQLIRQRTEAKMKAINRRLGATAIGASIGSEVVKPSFVNANAQQPTPKQVRRSQMVVHKASIEQKQQQIEQKKKEIEENLKVFSACPALKPVEARNYYMAQKPKGVDMYWICNRYNCSHASPKDCSAPQDGGVWHIYYGNEVLKVD